MCRLTSMSARFPTRTLERFWRLEPRRWVLCNRSYVCSISWSWSLYRVFLYDYTVHLVSPDRQITRYIVILIFCNLHFGYNVIYYIESERSGGPVGDSLKRVPTEVSAFPHSHVKQRRNRRCRMLERALVQKEALTIKRKSSIWKRPRAGENWATARDGFTTQERVFHAKESDRTIVYEY